MSNRAWTVVGCVCGFIVGAFALLGVFYMATVFGHLGH